MNVNDIPVLITIVGVITALTNIIVQVVKGVTYSKVPTNIVAVIVSEFLTITAGVAYAEMNQIAITWYMVVAAVVVGMMASYAAMFGFDKFKETIGDWPTE